MLKLKRADRLLPGLDDPRWSILVFLFSFVTYALNSPGFSRHPMQFAASIGTCLALDTFLLLFYKGLLLAPLSGLITSMGVTLLCDSPYVWPYALVAMLSILSKHFIRSEGRHIFNPNCFGVVIAVLFFGDSVTTAAGRWGGSMNGLCVVIALGMVVVLRARRADVSAAYAGTFAVGAFVRSAVTGVPARVFLTPMTGAAFQLFTFFMISDPMTTPGDPLGRWLFGVVVGALDACLRHKRIPNSPFFALFAVNALLPVWRAYAAPRPERLEPARLTT